MTLQAPPAALAPVRATFVIEDERARSGFLAWAERSLPRGLAVVQVRDVHGRRRAFRTLPASAGAQLAAIEAPLLLRGALTQVTRYYVVPEDELGAAEVHYEGEQESHRYDVQLTIAARGSAPAARVSA